LQIDAGLTGQLRGHQPSITKLATIRTHTRRAPTRRPTADGQHHSTEPTSPTTLFQCASLRADIWYDRIGVFTWDVAFIYAGG
jgi:hypothetical protein